MRMLMTKRPAAIAAAVLLVVVGGGVAYAFWTGSGTGTGSATTGSTAALTVNQTSTVTGMGPGVAPQDLSGNFDNPNPGPVFIKTVVATVTSTGVSGCTAADYTIAGTSVIGASAPGAGGDVPSGGAGVGSWSGLTIAFNETASNQDACKNAVVTIGYTTTSS